LARQVASKREPLLDFRQVSARSQSVCRFKVRANGLPAGPVIFAGGFRFFDKPV
jgi:hypothetical protein